MLRILRVVRLISVLKRALVFPKPAYYCYKGAHQFYGSIILTKKCAITCSKLCQPNLPIPVY